MSEITNITFKGVSNEPNDYQTEDGQLSVALNAVLHNGSVRAVGFGTELFEFDKDYKLMLIHHVGDDKVCVFYDEGDSKLIYSKVVNGQLGEEHELCSDVVVDKVTNIRKVLVISTSEGLRYARWDGTAYKYLGAFPKMPYVYPFLNTKAVRYSNISPTNISVKFQNGFMAEDGARWVCEESTLNADNKPLLEDVYNKVFACVNKCRNYVHSQGMFCSPFYVRFAIRLYDGTYAGVTKPYPLFPDSSYNPLCYFGAANENNTRSMDAIFPMSELSVWFDSIDQDWNDIIYGIDVFASKEVVGYTDSQKGLQELYKAVDEKPNEEHLCQDSKNETTTIEDVHESVSIVNLTSLATSDAVGKAKLIATKKWNDGDSISWVNVPGLNYTTNTQRLYAIKNTDYESGSRITRNGDVLIPLNESGEYSDYYNKLPEDVRNGNKIFYLRTQKFYKYVGNQITADVYSIDTTTYSGETTISRKVIVKFKRDDGIGANDEFKDVGNFYKIGEVKSAELSSPYLYTPEINEYDLDNLVTKQRLDESSIRPYDFVAGDVYIYNNRVNTVVEEQSVESAGYLEDMCGGTYEDEDGSTQDGITDAWVSIVSEGNTYVSKVRRETEGSVPMNFKYFFYPSLNANALYINTDIEDSSSVVFLSKIYTKRNGGPDFVKDDDGTVYFVESSKYGITYSEKIIRKIPLEKHNSLNGSYAFNGFSTLKATSNARFVSCTYTIPEQDDFNSGLKFYVNGSEAPVQPGPPLYTKAYELFKNKMKAAVGVAGMPLTPGKHTAASSGTAEAEYNAEVNEISNAPSSYHVGNKIIQSATENPFVFLNTGTNKIGCNEIYKLASTTKPISIGQFGEYPLYVFTDEGVWALSTNSDGTYGTIKPVSRDVCNNKDSITQLDQSILFSTSRGIMELQGGDVECITEVLNGHNFTGNISKLEDVLEVCSEEFAGITFDTHIQEFFKDCKIQYDYKRQLIYFFKEGCKLAYVFSLSSRTWGMMYNKGLVDTVTSYTNALVVAEGDSENKLIDLSVTSSDETLETDSLVITRPIMFGTDLHKTIEEIVLRGVYEGRTSASSGELKLVVWASNDMKNWLVIGSSNTDRWRNHSGTPYKAYRIGVVANWNEQDSLNSASVRYTPRMNNKLR